MEGGYVKDKDYELEVTYSKEGNFNIDLKIINSIEKTQIKGEFFTPEKIRTSEGKILTNKVSTIEFPGMIVLSKGAAKLVGSVTKAGKISSTVSVSASSATLAVSSMFSNALASLSKLVQIIEFSALMELYNVDYDQIMADFLRKISSATEFTLLNSPFEKFVDTKDHSVASIWKGKLSKIGSQPLFLQDLGYPGILMMVK